ncbi:5-(carboxyamino)imidazole ribonucleotide synthase [Candidatus Roizmanbacteria bacterium]|nr:5-(carboxyamino)imidazole ribonucleotide synthase [Candidatus Roizmanbacteria bacterium]
MKILGIVGGGQLGRMLTFEAKKLGFYVIILDPTPQSPASQVADEQIIADFKDEKAIRELAKRADYITFEIELANSRILDELAGEGVKINPSGGTLDIIKDKLRQKTFLQSVKIPVADFRPIESKEDVLKAIHDWGYPVVLKARFDAYDGRGNALIKSKKDIDPAFEKLQKSPLYVEKFVPFVKELSVIVARNNVGDVKAYPVVQTTHVNNICHIVRSPAPISPQIRRRAELLGKKVVKQLKGAGVFGIEMFLAAKGRVMVNEIAPRVHNSGHHTIEACVTSQFEQHVRAVTGLPLGDPSMIVPAAVMINILGDRTGMAEVGGLEQALKIPGATVHIYGKAETKPERKMGHITVIDKTLDKALAKAVKVRKLITI